MEDSLSEGTSESTSEGVDGSGSGGASVGESASGGASVDASSGSPPSQGTLYEALILQLGSFYRYKLYIPPLVPVDSSGNGSSGGGSGGGGGGGSSGSGGSISGAGAGATASASSGASSSSSTGAGSSANNRGPADTTVYRRLGTTSYSYSTSTSTSYLPNRQPITGELISCHLYRRNTNPVSYLLLPADVDMEQVRSHPLSHTHLINTPYPLDAPYQNNLSTLPPSFLSSQPSCLGGWQTNY